MRLISRNVQHPLALNLKKLKQWYKISVTRNDGEIFVLSHVCMLDHFNTKQNIHAALG